MRRLLLELQADGALTEQCVRLIVRMDLKRTRVLRPRLALRQRVGVPLARDDELGAVLANPLDLRRRSNGRQKDARGFSWRFAAYATATPWLPPDAATTPARARREGACWRTRRAP